MAKQNRNGHLSMSLLTAGNTAKQAQEVEETVRNNSSRTQNCQTHNGFVSADNLHTPISWHSKQGSQKILKRKVKLPVGVGRRSF
jgi:hypothetical protein